MPIFDVCVKEGAALLCMHSLMEDWRLDVNLTSRFSGPSQPERTANNPKNTKDQLTDCFTKSISARGLMPRHCSWAWNAGKDNQQNRRGCHHSLNETAISKRLDRETRCAWMKRKANGRDRGVDTSNQICFECRAESREAFPRCDILGGVQKYHHYLDITHSDP